MLACMAHGIPPGAIVHDPGKISIPAEMRAKPQALTPLEFEIIKTHTQVGYDILKNVKFLWPVARKVPEHH